MRRGKRTETVPREGAQDDWKRTAKDALDPWAPAEAGVNAGWPAEVGERRFGPLCLVGRARSPVRKTA